MRKSGIIFLLSIVACSLYASDNCFTATLANFTQCTSGHIEGTNTFNGPLSNCVSSNNLGSNWHYFYAPTHGRITIESNANFNDVLTIFKGDCDGLEEIYCVNRDEYGFHGENISIQLEPSTKYYLRINSQLNDFGLYKGTYCIQLSEGFLNEPTPSNNNCSNANKIKVDNEDQCSSNVNTNAWLPNKNASIEIYPNKNLKSRSSVWYFFTPYKSDQHLIHSNAWFADVITLYKGDCNTLKEIKTATDNQTLYTPFLLANQTYLIQITGYFANLESRLCPEVKRLANKPDNNSCDNATPLQLNANCIKGILDYANVNQKISSCIPVNGPSVWFMFNSADQTDFSIAIEAAFPYNLTLWEDNCNKGIEKHCITGHNSCVKLPHIKNLTSNTNYYLNVSADISFPIQATNFCIRLLDSSFASEVRPLQVESAVTCFTNGTGELQLNVSGGEVPYSFIGDQPNSILRQNEVFQTTVMDKKGCSINRTTFVECPSIETACPVVSNLQTHNITNSSLILTYTSANYKQNYNIKYKELISNSWNELASSNTYASLANLKACTQYEAKVLNVCGEFYGGYSESVFFKTSGCSNCQPPKELFTLNATSSSAFLHWDIVPDAIYVISYKAQNETIWNKHQSDFPFMLLFNLLPCTTYSWHIETICSINEQSEVSLDNHFTTLNCKNQLASSTLVYEVYPNPVKDYLVIKMNDKEFFSRKHQIKIFNTNGQLVFNRMEKPAYQTLKIQLNKYELPFGIYDLEITNSSFTHHQKIIFQ